MMCRRRWHRRRWHTHCSPCRHASVIAPDRSSPAPVPESSRGIAERFKVASDARRYAYALVHQVRQVVGRHADCSGGRRHHSFGAFDSITHDTTQERWTDHGHSSAPPTRTRSAPTQRLRCFRRRSKQETIRLLPQARMLHCPSIVSRSPVSI